MMGVLMTVMPGPLAAQLCRALPIGRGEARLATLIGRAGGGDGQWGGAVSYGLPGRTTAHLGYARTGVAEEGDDPLSTLRVGAAARVGGLGSSTVGEKRISGCATADLERSTLDVLTVHAVRMGLGVGTRVAASGDWTLLVSAEPQAVYTHASVPWAAEERVSPGARAGAALTWKDLSLRGAYEWVKASRNNRTLTLELGVRFGQGPGSGIATAESTPHQTRRESAR